MADHGGLVTVSVDEAAERAELSSPRESRLSFLAVMRNREYRGVALAQVASECGDQICAVALSVLVYGRSHNAFLAAATYAVAYVPWVVGSLLLAPLADRFPRRRVMLVCDLVRAALTGLLAVLASTHRTPIGLLLALVLLVTFFSPPFSNSRSAVLPDIFPAGSKYVRAIAIGRILQQVDQVFGFALGGAIVAALSPAGALAVDAGTFLLSFGVLATYLRPRPTPDASLPSSVRAFVRALVPDMSRVVRDKVRAPLLVLAGGALLFMVAPESLAVPYAHVHGHGSVAAGLLLASQPCGVAIGSWLLIRFVPPRVQGRVLLALAVLSALVQASVATNPALPFAVLLWALTGLGQSFMVATIAAYNLVTPAGLRGRANGIASAIVSLTQGVGFLVWGAVGAWRGPAAAIAWSGVLGLLFLVVLRYFWPHEHIRQAWLTMEAAQPPTH